MNGNENTNPSQTFLRKVCAQSARQLWHKWSVRHVIVAYPMLLLNSTLAYLREV